MPAKLPHGQFYKATLSACAWKLGVPVIRKPWRVAEIEKVVASVQLLLSMEKHSSVAANGPCPGSLPQRRIFTYKLANKQQTWKPNGKSSGVQAGSPSHLLAESLHLLPRRCHAGVARNLREAERYTQN